MGFTAAGPAAPDNDRLRGRKMLYLTIVFFIIALVAGVLGFTGIAAGAVEIAKILFLVFVVLFVVSLLIGRRRRRPVER